MWPLFWIIGPIIAALVYERWSVPVSDPLLTDTSGSGSIAADAVQRALSAVGGRYTWGGSDPTVGWDCSGLIAWAYGLAHQTAADLYAAVEHVAGSDLRPGDLLFYDFNGTGTIDHVVMYVGAGMVVAAADPADGVVHQPLYTTGLVGVGRVSL